MTCVPCGSFWVSSFASSHFAPFVAAYAGAVAAVAENRDAESLVGCRCGSGKKSLDNG